MKILIADDHLLVREGLKQVLKTIEDTTCFDDIPCIDEAQNGTEALKKIESQNYDLVILDISMPEKTGLDLLTIINNKELDVRVLILSVHPQEQYAIRALKLGASGYLCKNSIYEELEKAIRTILSGKKYISSVIAEKMLFNLKDDYKKNPHEKLSEREFQIMCMLAKGQGVNEIARELFISDKTVSTHRSRLLEKMGLTRNAELTLYAFRNNLIE